MELSGGGEAGSLIQSFDWSKTAIGPSGSWPAALQALVGVMMNTRQPMLLWWGPELIQIYNDAMVPSLGQAKHPSGLGQGARKCWPEVWPVVGAQLERADGTAIWSGVPGSAMTGRSPAFSSSAPRRRRRWWRAKSSSRPSAKRTSRAKSCAASSCKLRCANAAYDQLVGRTTLGKTLGTRRRLAATDRGHRLRAGA